MTVAVSVATPWEPNTYIPRDSLVTMKCTGEKNQTLKWSITLPDNPNVLQFSFPISIALLNRHNFYEMQEFEHEMYKTIELFINNTEGTNGTRIQCVEPGAALSIYETTLTVYGKLPSWRDTGCN